MTATLHSLAEARKRKIIRDAKAAMGLIHVPFGLSIADQVKRDLLAAKRQSWSESWEQASASLLPCEPPCDVER